MNKENDMICPNEAYAIIGAAMEVQNELGCGFAELVYHEALNIELNLRNIPYETEKLITNYIKKLTKKVYFYAIDDTKPSTYG